MMNKTIMNFVTKNPVIPAQAGIQRIELDSQRETKPKYLLNKNTGFRPTPDNQRLASLPA